MKSYIMDDFFPGTRAVRVYEEESPTLRINCGAASLSVATESESPPLLCTEVFHLVTEKELSHTLKARDYKDPLIVLVKDE